MTGPLLLRSPTALGGLSAAAPEPERATDADFGWLSIIRIVRRRALLIALVTFAVALAALPLILSVEKTYYGQARLLFTQNPTLTLAGEPLKAAAQLDVQEEIERLVSRETSLAMIQRLDLANLPEFNPDLRQTSALESVLGAVRSLMTSTSAEDEDDAADMEFVLSAYRSALEVWNQPQTGVVTIGFHTQDPELAAEVPNALAEIHRAQNQARWQAQVDEALHWLDTQLADNRARLAQSRAALDDVRTRSGLASAAALDATEARLGLIEERQTDIRRQRFDIQGKLDSVAASERNPELPSASEPANVRDLRQELRTQSRDLQNLLSTFGENYDGVAALRASIGDLQAQLTAELNAYRDSLQAQDAALADREAAVEKQAATLRSSLAEQRLAVPELERLSKTVQAHADSLALLEYQHQKLLAESRIVPVQIDILSPATFPLYPEGTSRKVLLMAAIFGGLLLGLTAAGCSELLDRGVRGHEQLVHLRQFVPVGLLPSVRSAERAGLDKAIMSRRETKFTEALRDAVFMLECANGGVFPSSLLVTCAGSRRTPVAGWIAAELSASGRKTTLVDVGGKRGAAPSSGAVVSKKPGQQSDMRMAPGAHKGVARLAFTGDPTRDPLARDAFDGFLKKSSLEGLITIVDGPPVQNGAALRIGQKVDAVLLVLEWGRTPKPVAELVAGLLTKTRIDRAFTLIVEVDPKRHRLYGFTDRMSLPAGSDSVTG